MRLISGLLGILTIDAVEGDPAAATVVSRQGLMERIGAALLLNGNASSRASLTGAWL